ncbi:MAG: nucleotidyltransferase domain-containing protein [Methanosarcinales archaeon]|nr:MAG: nucleotidyltransferase domain-containing protein [Methanosarcinales archaeon]
MKADTNLKTGVKQDFKEFYGDALGILLYGSRVQGCWSERSDIDICIVAPDNDYVLRRINKKLGGKYDVKVFEKMPLYIRINAIRNHRIIYGDAARIGSYFYRFRRLWADMEPRILDNRFNSVDERMALRRRWMREKRTILEETGSF